MSLVFVLYFLSCLMPYVVCIVLKGHTLNQVPVESNVFKMSYYEDDNELLVIDLLVSLVLFADRCATVT